MSFQEALQDTDEQLAAHSDVEIAPDNVSAIPPRRILYIDHTACLGGGEIALLNLVKHIDKRRFDPVVLLFSDGPLAERLRDASISTHILPLSGDVLNARKGALGLATFLKLTLVFRVIIHIFHVARFIRRVQIDLVHTNSLKADIIGGLAARLAFRMVIWHVRDRIDADYLPRPVVAVFRFLSRWLPSYVIANSEATLRTIQLSEIDRGTAVYSGIDVRARLHVVHDGTSTVASLIAEPKSRTNLLIGLVGRLSPWKGQHIFLQAAVEVRKSFPHARFQIIGSALFAEKEYEQEVKTLAESLGLSDIVEFTGFRSDVPELISQLDILVHASTTGEPFGQVVIEGMAAEKPVVATNGGGVPEIVVDGLTGLLVPMNDHVTMAAAIRRLLADSKLRYRMGKFGRQRVIEHFTIARTGSRLQEVYGNLLRPGTRFGEKLRQITGQIWRQSILVSLTSTVAVVIGLHLRRYVATPHATPFTSFFAAIIACTWFGGLAWGTICLCLNVLAISYFILPPAGFSFEKSDWPRVLLFIAISLLMNVLIDQLRKAVRRANKAVGIAEESKRQTNFLARASTILAAASGESEIVSQLAFLSNSELSDWCVVDLLLPSGKTRRVIAAHRDPAMDEYMLKVLTARSCSTPLLRFGVAALDPPQIEKGILGIETAGSCHPLIMSGLGSSITAPLVAQGEIFGILALFRASPGRRRFDSTHLNIAIELSSRATMALVQSTMKTDLQRHEIPSSF